MHLSVFTSCVGVVPRMEQAQVEVDSEAMQQAHAPLGFQCGDAVSSTDEAVGDAFGAVLRSTRAVAVRQSSTLATHVVTRGGECGTLLGVELLRYIQLTLQREPHNLLAQCHSRDIVAR